MKFKSSVPHNRNTVTSLIGIVSLVLLYSLLFLDADLEYYYGTGLVIVIVGALLLLINNYNQGVRLLYKETNRILTESSDDDTSSYETKWVRPLLSNWRVIRNRINEAVNVIGILGEHENLNFEHLSENDKLGRSLKDMHHTIRLFNEEESKRKWKVEGLARFVEVLRNNSADFEEYCFNIISEIVRYTNCNQGGLYVSYEDSNQEQYLELKASFAYERRKFLKKKINAGQGLLGECMLEKEVIFITDIPADYIKITSGLGEAVPNNIVIVPLIVNERFYGAVELASFHVLERYQIEFLEELSESIAASFGNIKTSDHTKKLLDDSQSLATELQSREEEMKQNLEELAATQEDMQRNQAQLNGVFNAINSTMAMAEIDINGMVIKINTILQDILGVSNDHVAGNTLSQLLGSDADANSLWSKLLNKEMVSGEFKIDSSKGNIWLDTTFTPILNTSNSLERVLMLSKDITSEKELAFENQRRDVELQSHISAINKTIASCEYDMKGNIMGANDIFIGITGFKLEDLIGKHHLDLIPELDRDKPQTELMWSGIKDGKFFSGEFKLMSNNGKELWLTGTYNPILDSANNPYKVMMFAQFTTDEKEKKVDLSGMVGALKNTLPVIEVKLDRTFKSANKLFFEEFGYSRMQLRGKTFEEIVGDPSPDIIISMFKPVQNKDFIEEFITFYYPDRTTKRFKTTFTPIYNLEGNISKIVIILVDPNSTTEAIRKNKRESLSIENK